MSFPTLGFAAASSVLANSVSWFPQDYAAEFYYTKGLVALVATVLVVVHMSQTWPQVRTRGQQLRYLTLLAFSVLLTGSSVEQVHQGALVNYRNLGGLVVAVMILVAMVVSIREDSEKP